MPAVIAALAQLIGSAFGKIFSDKVISWVAWKALLVLMCFTLLPLMLNNFLYDIIEIVMNFASGQAGGASSLNGAMNFSGFGGWLIEMFRLPECLSVLISALVLRIALSMVPFVRL